MKKSLMALGGDDTKEEIRDLLNQSDISIIGAKVITEKSQKSCMSLLLFIVPPLFPDENDALLYCGPIKDILFLSQFRLPPTTNCQEIAIFTEYYSAIFIATSTI